MDKKSHPNKNNGWEKHWNKCLLLKDFKNRHMSDY